MGKVEWIKVQNPKAGDIVKLAAYRKARGNDEMLGDRRMFLDKIAIVEDVCEGQKDDSGCRLAWVRILNYRFAWRISSLRKKREKIKSVKKIGGSSF